MPPAASTGHEPQRRPCRLGNHIDVKASAREHLDRLALRLGELTVSRRRVDQGAHQAPATRIAPNGAAVAIDKHALTLGEGYDKIATHQDP